LEEIKKDIVLFLRKKRKEFARLYLLGDDDLLTLIGQSKDISRATGHLQKIFIGVSGLTVSKANIITALKSPDG